jgi:hypothetical protein
MTSIDKHAPRLGNSRRGEGRDLDRSGVDQIGKGRLHGRREKKKYKRGGFFFTSITPDI